MSREIVQLPGEGEVLLAGPTRSIVKIPGAATAGRLGVVEMHIEAGWEGPPPHTHREVDHVWYLLDGSINLTVSDTTCVFAGGSCLFVPAGVPHSFGTVGLGAATLLQIDSPRVLDSYFRELAEAFPPGRPVDPAKVGDIMRRHDTHPVTGIAG